MSTQTLLTPMRASGIHHQVARVYREGGPHQWVRETLVNALEARAQRVEFGIEWQAVAAQDVYRRTIADDGVGMTPEQLVRFFNTWGGGGKPIGGMHENFGIGAKSSLLPWNHYGLVVVSWVGGVPAMIWVMADPQTGEYGLRNFDARGEEGQIEIADVVAPFADEEHGCDWNAIKPSWMGDHGTVIVLMGESPKADTVLGDPNRPLENGLTAIAAYLNRRFWRLPEGVQVNVEELRSTDRQEWPRSSAQARATSGIRTHRRKIEGAEYYITYPSATYKRGQLAAAGTVGVGHGVAVDWYLWEGVRPGIQSYAATGGYIGALYKGELYDVTNHHATYRSFGVLESAVRARLWLVMRPAPFDENHRYGVYPRADRNALLLMGRGHVGDPLPTYDWGARFAEQMPAPIREAIRQARAGGVESTADDAWRTRLVERFGARWRLFKLKATKAGDFDVEPLQTGTPVREATAIPLEEVNTHDDPGDPEDEERRTPEQPSDEGPVNTGSQRGPRVASRHRVGGGIPTWTAVRAGDLGQGMLAAWAPHHPEHPEGAVLINIEHPVLEEEIAYWQSQYPEHLADAIAIEVIAAYGEIAVAKVAHSEHLTSVLPRRTVEDDLRSEAALTMALLGLIGEEAVIAPRVSGKFGRRRTPEAA